jgi:hypothetical protein
MTRLSVKCPHIEDGGGRLRENSRRARKGVVQNPTI